MADSEKIIRDLNERIGLLIKAHVKAVSFNEQTFEYWQKAEQRAIEAEERADKAERGEKFFSDLVAGINETLGETNDSLKNATDRVIELEQALDDIKKVWIDAERGASTFGTCTHEWVDINALRKIMNRLGEFYDFESDTDATDSE